MESNYKVFYTEEAQEDIRQVALLLLDIAWPKSAEKWVNKILDRSDSLAMFPEGNAVYEYDNRFRSVRVGRYRIIYEVYKSEKLVAILRVVYVRRNLKKITIKK